MLSMEFELESRAESEQRPQETTEMPHGTITHYIDFTETSARQLKVSKQGESSSPSRTTPMLDRTACPKRLQFVQVS